MLSVMTIVIIAANPEQNFAAATTLRVVGLVASGSMSALWLIVYLLPIEIFPTVIRNIAMGGCSIMARIGAVLGPQLLYLVRTHPSPSSVAPYIPCFSKSSGLQLRSLDSPSSQ